LMRPAWRSRLRRSGRRASRPTPGDVESLARPCRHVDTYTGRHVGVAAEAPALPCADLSCRRLAQTLRHRPTRVGARLHDERSGGRMLSVDTSTCRIGAPSPATAGVRPRCVAYRYLPGRRRRAPSRAPRPRADGNAIPGTGRRGILRSATTTGVGSPPGTAPPAPCCHCRHPALSTCRHVWMSAYRRQCRYAIVPAPRRALRSRRRSRLSICRHARKPTGRQVDAPASSSVTTARYATRCRRAYASTARCSTCLQIDMSAHTLRSARGSAARLTAARRPR
jgi:hypothetical protein